MSLWVPEEGKDGKRSLSGRATAPAGAPSGRAA
jgi:hypothetical protein